MIDSGAKINVQDTDAGKVITIYPQLKTWQKFAFRAWLAVWIVTGLLAFTGARGICRFGLLFPKL